jgi:hypothetical protein
VALADPRPDGGEQPLITRLADVPLPSGGHALIEINLLGWGLTGCRAGDIDRHIAFWEASVEAGLSDSPGLAHLLVELHGSPLGGGWIEKRADGTGRNYLAVDPARHAGTHQVRLDLARRPASERLRLLLASLPHEQARWQPPHNALFTADTALLPVRHSHLLTIEGLVAEGLGPDASGWSPLAAGVSAQIEGQLQQLRHDWAIDAPEAAAYLLAAQLPAACAQQHPGSADLAELIHRRYLLIAAEHVRDGPDAMAMQLVSEAAAGGYARVLNAVADMYYTRALVARDAALDGPPDPMQFGRQLYNVAPYAYAVMLICAALRTLIGQPAAPGEVAGRARLQTDATELFIRVGDGIFLQYMDWCLALLDREREKVAAAQARGDRREVWKLIRGGEFALRWPRSYRPYLLGEAPVPAVRYPGPEET